MEHPAETVTPEVRYLTAGPAFRMQSSDSWQVLSLAQLAVMYGLLALLPGERLDIFSWFCCVGCGGVDVQCTCLPEEEAEGGEDGDTDHVRAV